jgi:ABC-type nitrate/sulfonate/bicarbonate transport system substrate-binding protein
MSVRLRRRPRHTVGAIAITVAGLLAAACGSSGSSTSSNPDNATTSGKITYLKNSPCPALPGGTVTETQPSVAAAPAFAFLYAGLAAGIFAKCDINLTVANMDPTVNTSSYIGGTLQNLNVSVSSLPATVAAAGQGLAVFAALSDKYPGEFLVNSKITGVQGLKGQTIGALSPFDSTERSASYFLTQNGINPTTGVRFSYLDTVPDMVAAIEAGSVAGGSVPQPYAAEAVAQGHLKVLYKFADSGFSYPTLPLVANPTWLKANTAAALNLLRAYIASVYYVGTHVNQSVADVVSYLNIQQGPSYQAEVSGIRGYMTDFYKTPQQILSYPPSSLKAFYTSAAPAEQAKITDPSLKSFVPSPDLSKELLSDGFLARLKQVYGS